MSNYYNQHQVPVSHPPGPQGPQVMAPPPIGYPTEGGYGEHHQNHSSGKTTSRGDGFLKGCFAALCCCCVLDACF